uniref:Predicted protein n=1 Tax=Physcomitrium patens TaxID=3218 RepID=A9TUZ3_PHYPA
MFLGAYIFYRITIPHYAHIRDLLYELLRKDYRFKWKRKHTEVMQKLKVLWVIPSILRKIDYDYN